MMKMTGNASTMDNSTRAWWVMAGVAVVFALFWETRALVSVQIVEVPAERVLHMAETGTIRWARIGGGTLIVAAARPHDATATSRLREAAGLPADGRLFVVRPATAADLVALRAAIERHAVEVRGWP